MDNEIVPEVEELSEAQLRQLYDNEEIDRFLHLFAAHVTEVQLPDIPSNVAQAYTHQKDTSLSESEGLQNVESPPPPHEPGLTLSETIAFRYVLPYLPPPPLPAPAFTLGRLRLATQRVYLSIWPVYVPFFHHLVVLSTWKDRSRSARYCLIFWVLWYYNLLLPAFFFRIFYALLRRKIFTYPTVAELRERRRQVDRANELGDEISFRLSASSFGLKEMWRISRILIKPKKSKTKAKTPASVLNVVPGSGSAADDTAQAVDSTVAVDDRTILDDTTESQKERDMKRAVLQALNEIADTHERVKNIFIWRKSASSRIYGSALFFCSLVTLLLPAQYIAKLVYFLCGIFFWHIIPVLAALSPEDRSRFPPAFQDVPTDSEFAMEVISQRITAGLDVNPSKVQTKPKGKSNAAGELSEALASAPTTPSESKGEKTKDINWKKWGERAAIGKAWVGNLKEASIPSIVASNAAISQSSLTSETPLPPDDTHSELQWLTFSESNFLLNLHPAFPCQHTSSPGLLTLSRSMLFFTPIAASRPKLSIPFTDLRGVKKTGLLKGLTVKWVDSSSSSESGGSARQEVFPWVGGRDEMFARLIGTDVKRWMKA
ncbi:hypothetical protein BDP27DRAFT_1285189 [Rhodocollybia butyracea]|uniref:Uncharacterized protein n=1 Tax=Rhodocollybia butyracea TaxID=206335 RepID=A0A9P5UEI8_9AGAR|nr:hypothetical protein BDP27DRAFT_1285189 [Rhodocollybia butyracea]